MGDANVHQILDAAPDAMLVVDARMAIRLVNLQTEKLFGYSRAELIGQSLELLIPHRYRAGHGMQVERYLRAPTLRTMGSGLELSGLRKDGTEIAIEVSLSPFDNHGEPAVTAAIRDITERKRLQAAKNVALARLSGAVESIQEAFALFDERDNLALCNSAYRRLLAPVLPGQLVGRSYQEIVDARVQELELVDAAQRAQLRTSSRPDVPTSRTEINVRTRDERSLRIVGQRTSDGGFVETIWDLTDDARLAADLREARLAAEAASAAKTEFLSSMSHEVRTPLNAILGFAQLLQRDKKRPLDQVHHEYVAQILKGGALLLRLIDDILDLSRIEARGVSISTEPVDVCEALDELRAGLAPTAAQAGVQLEVAHQRRSDVPRVAADRTRFLQILGNFGSNALKYNRPGGKVTFSISTPSPERLVVMVTDTGIGIPAAKQDLLFQPFQRAGQEAGPIQGTGIGLAIAKRLAELMGGTVGFRSTPGQGSDFWVEMPVHSSSVIEEVAALIPLQAVSDAERRAAVLYIEDNPANITFMEHLLDALGNFDLTSARTAEIGLEIARAKLPHVIIVDINLPGMSGLDALQILQSWPETAKIPVIALTAAAKEHDRRRGEEAGFYRYLAKPLRIDEFEQVLGSALQQARAQVGP
ncbi:MAG TPA: ATP-binding protein [Polyangiaceae bacterium]|nr:ATP-binding protein [Polyangiaceae bacterium]